MSDFESQWRSIAPSMYRFALKLTRNSETAEDLLSDTSIRVFCNFHRFDGRCSFNGWCMKIMHNLHLDSFKGKRRLRPQLFSDSPHEGFAGDIVDPSTPIDDAICSELVGEQLQETLLLSMPWQFAELLLMVADGCKVVDIARNLGIPEGTVKSRLNRARRTAMTVLAA
jgi:RNA polymerase sigma-70 factor (ECF subfamily)